MKETGSDYSTKKKLINQKGRKIWVITVSLNSKRHNKNARSLVQWDHSFADGTAS